MAKRSTLEEIAILEDEEAGLMQDLKDIGIFKALQSQGNQGSRTEFMDRRVLKDMLKEVRTSLSVERRKAGI